MSRGRGGGLREPSRRWPRVGCALGTQLLELVRGRRRGYPSMLGCANTAGLARYVSLSFPFSFISVLFFYFATELN